MQRYQEERATLFGASLSFSRLGGGENEGVGAALAPVDQKARAGRHRDTCDQGEELVAAKVQGMLGHPGVSKSIQGAERGMEVRIQGPQG